MIQTLRPSLASCLGVSLIRRQLQEDLLQTDADGTQLQEVVSPFDDRASDPRPYIQAGRAGDLEFPGPLPIFYAYHARQSAQPSTQRLIAIRYSDDDAFRSCQLGLQVGGSVLGNDNALVDDHD